MNPASSSGLATAPGKDGLFSADPSAAATLGDVLYGDGGADQLLAERDWVVLVNYIAAGDQRALRQIYERTHRLVFTLIARITNSRKEAEHLTVDVFSETRHPLSVPVSGDMVLRLTWADGTVDLDLYLTAASCSVSLYPLNNCSIVAQSVALTGNTETIARAVTAGQQYQIWIDNLSPTLAMNYTLSIDID